MASTPPSEELSTAPQPRLRRFTTSSFRRWAQLLALLFGFFLLLASVSGGSGFLPWIRSVVGGTLFSIVFPPGSVYSVQIGSIFTLGLAVGLLVVGAAPAADLFIREISLLMPSVAATVRSSAVVLSLGANVSETMIKAGVTGRPMVYVRRYAVYAVASAIVVIPSSFALTLIVGEPLLLLLNAIPFALLMFPTINISSKVGDTVRGVEEELPYFSVLAAILESAGMTLYGSLTKVADARIFKWIGYEGKLVARESLFFGKTQVGAILERGTQHPSEKFRAYLQGYTSMISSGGDAARYLEGKAKDLIYWTEFRWRGYAQSASDLGEAIIAIFFTLPLIVIAGAIVSPGDTLALTVGTVVVIIPIMAVLEYSAIIRIQPKTYDAVVGWALPGLTAAFAAFAVLVLLRQPTWMSVAGAIVALSAVYGTSTFWQLREVRKCEEALPHFMRDITEYKKIGYDVTKAVKRLAAERHYNGHFDRVLRDVGSQLQLGLPMKDVIIKTRSWLSRMIFYLLGQVVDSGGGTPSLLETVTDFTQRIVGVRRETKSSMRIYGVLAYATPIGLAFVIITMYYMLKQFGGIVGGGSGFGILGGTITLPPAFLDISKVLVVEAATVVAFLAGKTIDFTGKSTFRMTIGVTLAIVGVLMIEQLIPQLGFLSV